MAAVAVVTWPASVATVARVVIGVAKEALTCAPAVPATVVEMFPVTVPRLETPAEVKITGAVFGLVTCPLTLNRLSGGAVQQPLEHFGQHYHRCCKIVSQLVVIISDLKFGSDF